MTVCVTVFMLINDACFLANNNLLCTERSPSRLQIYQISVLCSITLFFFVVVVAIIICSKLNRVTITHLRSTKCLNIAEE